MFGGHLDFMVREPKYVVPTKSEGGHARERKFYWY